MAIPLRFPSKQEPFRIINALQNGRIERIYLMAYDTYFPPNYGHKRLYILMKS